MLQEPPRTSCGGANISITAYSQPARMYSHLENSGCEYILVGRLHAVMDRVVLQRSLDANYGWVKVATHKKPKLSLLSFSVAFGHIAAGAFSYLDNVLHVWLFMYHHMIVGSAFKDPDELKAIKLLSSLFIHNILMYHSPSMSYSSDCIQ